MSHLIILYCCGIIPNLEHRAAHALGHLVYAHISCISRASYALLTMLYEKILYHVTIVTYTKSG